MQVPMLSAAEAVDKIIHQSDAWRFIDVRSEGEWEKAASPGFKNLPLLNDVERHLVGIKYKNKGQDEAIKLGEELVGPHLDLRLKAWVDTADGCPTVVCCWRGGMRSGLVAGWLRDNGVEAYTIDGGYKSVRRLYINTVESLPHFFVLSGLTGVNKTGLLKSCSVFKIDLEGLANHRGSTFGHSLSERQPAQISFENELSFRLYGKNGPVLVEDESVHIGRIRLPIQVRNRIINDPVIILEATLEERVDHIIEEYITQPVEQGFSIDVIREFTLKNLGRIERRLGGKLKVELEHMVLGAFNKGITREEHGKWIAMLLETYYDPMYLYGLERHKRPVLFQGDFTSCKTWIEKTMENPSA